MWTRPQRGKHADHKATHTHKNPTTTTTKTHTHRDVGVDAMLSHVVHRAVMLFVSIYFVVFMLYVVSHLAAVAVFVFVVVLL